MPEFQTDTPRSRTRGALLKIIRNSSGVTRGELAEATGLPASTVSHGVSRLILEDLVSESDFVEKGVGSGSGRPGKLLWPVWSNDYVAGIDFGHDYVSVAVASHSGEILTLVSQELDAEHNPDRALSIAIDLLRKSLNELGGQTLSNIVVGIPFPISEDGCVLVPLHASNWSGTNPAKLIAGILGVPVVAQTNTVLAAIGEMNRGAAVGVKDFMYVVVSIGLGATLILNGSPYLGAGGLAGDIGHIKVPSRADLCRCGDRGCLEATVAKAAIVNQIFHTHPRMLNTDDPFEVVDEATQRILSEAGRALGKVLSIQSDLLDPEMVLVGGSIAEIHPSFVEGIRQIVEQPGRIAVAKQVQVVTAMLGKDAGAIGAITLALQNRGAKPRAGSNSLSANHWL